MSDQSLKTYSTIALPEATYFEIRDIRAQIQVQRSKAIFVFPISPELAKAKAAFDDPETQVKLQNFLTAMNSLKRRMFAHLIEEKGD